MKIGFHAGPGGNKNGIGDYFRKLDAAGIPAVFKSTDDYGSCGELAGIAAASGVPHQIVFRLTTAGQNDGKEYDVPPYFLDPVTAAQTHWATTKAKLPPEFDKEHVWLELTNEVDKNRADWLGRFAIAISNIATAEGYKIALFGWSSGEPEISHWQTPGMLDFLRFAAIRRDEVAVSLHEYSFDRTDIWSGSPFLVGRFQQLFDVCDLHGIVRPTVLITEWGWELGNIPSPTVAITQIEQVAELYEAHPTILGAFTWNLGRYQNTDIHNQTQKLIVPVTNLALEWGPTDPPPPPPPTGNNLLRNSNFEGGWWHPNGITELQVPNEWGFEYYLWPEYANPWNSDVVNRFIRAEVRILTRDFIPPNEWDDFFWTAESLQTMKIFFRGAWYSHYFQDVNLPEGTYEFRARGFADLVAQYGPNGKVWANYDPDDPFNSPAGLMRVNGSDWVVWEPGKKQEVIFTIEGPIDRLWVEVMCPFAIANSGFFFDEWELVAVTEEECRGKPRTQYGREYVLLPPDADKEWFAAAARGGSDRRLTIGGSADDAGIGDLDVRKVIAVNPSGWGGDLNAFFLQYYPGITFTPLLAASPAELESKLKAMKKPLVERLLNSQFDEPTAPQADGSCRGGPRVQYGRDYVLLPPSAGKDWYEAAARGGSDRRLTIGGSADDAGIGDLDDREIIAVNPDDWDGDLNAFFLQYYPGITFTPLLAASPAELETKLDPSSSNPGFGNPVAMTGSIDGEVWPPYWEDVNPIGSFYRFGPQNQYTAYHTGADLNLNYPVYDSDKLAPVYAIWSGIVTHAGKLSGTWWDVVVIRHTLPGGLTIYSRHSHLDSFTVTAGQSVFKGQQIGKIGNAGGQLSYHLHFDTSLTNILEADPGHWPGTNLGGVMANYVEPRSLIRISRSGFFSKTVYVKSSANFRSGPATSFRIYKTLPVGTAVTAIGLVDDYYLVKTSAAEYGFVYASLTQDTSPTPPVGDAKFGLHASADGGDMKEVEFVEFRTAEPLVIKALSSTSGPSIGRLATDHPNAAFIIRAFLDFGGRNISPTQFVNDTGSDVQRAINTLSGRDVLVELHNEPNLTSEGLGSTWPDGAGFNSWLLQVLNLYRSALPGTKFMYPGLSPQFGGFKPFLAASKQAALACDAVGLHTYWNSGNYPVSSALADDVDYYVNQFPNKELWVTECSNNKGGVNTPAEKANQYIQFWTELKKRPSVKGMTVFVASASNPIFGWEGGSDETWIEYGVTLGMGAIVGTR